MTSNTDATLNASMLLVESMVSQLMIKSSNDSSIPPKMFTCLIP